MGYKKNKQKNPHKSYQLPMIDSCCNYTADTRIPCFKNHLQNLMFLFSYEHCSPFSLMMWLFFFIDQKMGVTNSQEDRIHLLPTIRKRLGYFVYHKLQYIINRIEWYLSFENEQRNWKFVVCLWLFKYFDLVFYHKSINYIISLFVHMHGITLHPQKDGDPLPVHLQLVVSYIDILD